MGLGGSVHSVVEALETRRLLSTTPTPTLDAGTLHVQGTDGRDVILFSLREHQTVLRVSVNGTKTDFPLAGVFGIEADGGLGNDVIVMGYRIKTAASLSGGDGNDLLVGARSDDVLSGGEGNDKLFGRQGNDTMSGDGGNDHMHGGAGDDNMGGGEGNDVMDGDAGADVMLGEAGNDRMNGGAGNDQMSGAEGDDDVNGGAGTDLVIGGDGHDTFHGSDKASEIYDKTADDVVRGEKRHHHEEKKHEVPEIKTKK
jgi:Ca2+-binding RTX toxin-like protein